MSHDDLEIAFGVIRSCPDADFEGPKAESLIAKAEDSLGCRFPSTYRRFLLEFGCGDCYGLEIYGVINDAFADAGIPDAVWATLRERRDSGLPTGCIVIGSTESGSLWVIDTSQTRPNDEAPVVEWVPGGSNDLTNQVSADDFGHWLLRELQSHR
jgi:hypothetical protein